MKTLACADLGTPECPFMAEDETAEGAVATMIEHAKDVHADKIAGKSDEELEEMMAPNVKEEA